MRLTRRGEWALVLAGSVAALAVLTILFEVAVHFAVTIGA